MSAVLLPLADHGGVVSFLPFVAPMALIVIGLAVIVARDRLGRRDGDGGDAPSSSP